MKQVRIAVCAAFAAVLFVAARAGAEGEVVDQAKEMMAKWVDVNAMVATTYTHGFNNPSSNTLNYNVINKANDTFALYDAFLQFGRNRDDEDFGFTVNMDFGETAKYTEVENSGSFALREAYGTYKLPWDGIKLKVGKMVTLLGYEVLMTNTSFNPNISHSILFGYAINFTDLGLMFNVPLGEIASLDIGVINGWDNPVDNNHQKTFMMGIGLKPVTMASFYLSGSYGGEANGQEQSCTYPNGTSGPCAGAGSKQGVVTLNGTLTPIEGLSFIVDSVYGNESNFLPDSSGNLNQAAQWYGLVGYVTWAPGMEQLQGLSLNLRAEIFDDVNGARLTGSSSAFTPNPALSGQPLTVAEVTPTVAYQFNPHVLARLEYRYDSADKLAYQTASGYSKIANTLAAELLVAF